MANFAYTGAVQAYVVPAGVNQVVIETVGGEGGYKKSAAWAPSAGSTRGGAGSYLRSIHNVTPGETLSVYVGGSPNNAATPALRSNGGYNGGGHSIFETDPGTFDAGGGATDVRRGGSTLAHRICVAGGGGGNGIGPTGAVLLMGGNAGLDGGVAASGASATSGKYSVAGGKGASTVAGGAGGLAAPETGDGQNGELGVGGAGGATFSTGTGGGGGGGLYGGGGGGGLGSDLTAGAGGGGGSTGVIGTAGRSLGSLVNYNFTGSANASPNGNGRATVNPYVPPVPVVTAVTNVTTKSSPLVMVNVVDLHPSATGQRTFVHELSQSETFASGVISNTTTLPVGALSGAAFATLPKQGTWYIRVKGGGTGGMAESAWSATQSFTVTHVPSTTIVGPTSDSYVIWNTTVPFSFATTDSASATGDTVSAYQILVERNDSGAVVKDSGKVTLEAPFGQHTVDVALGAELRDLKLRWRVRVWDSTDTPGPYSSYGLFTATLPPAVVINSPANGGSIGTGAPTVTWTNTLSGGRPQVRADISIIEVSSAAVVWTGVNQSAATSATPLSTVLVNGTAYVVNVKVTDSIGLVGEASNAFTTAYVSPDPIHYSIEADRVETLGRVLIDWSATSPDPAIVAWHIYRRELPGLEWSLLAVINDAAQRTYEDFMVRSGISYMYNVTQVADRSGALLESPVGSRAKTSIASPRTNLASDPRATRSALVNGQAGWASRGFGAGGAGATTLVANAADGPEVQPGVKVNSYIRKTWTTASTDVADSGFDHTVAGVSGAASATTAMPVTPGGVLSVSSYVRHNAATSKSAAVRIVFRDAAGARILPAPTFAQVAVPSNTWVRVSASAAVPANAATVSLASDIIAPGTPWVAGNTLDGTALLPEDSQTARGYFDGFTLPSGLAGFAVRWIGAQNASRSELYEYPFTAEDRVFEIRSSNYWIIAPDAPRLTMLIPSVIAAPMSEEYESATFSIVGRGRHRDYGDRLGYTGSLTFQVRKPEAPSTVRQNVEALRRAQETYFLRTPFGQLFSVALGDPSWTPLPGVGESEMGDMVLPFEEVN